MEESTLQIAIAPANLAPRFSAHRSSAVARLRTPVRTGLSPSAVLRFALRGHRLPCLPAPASGFQFRIGQMCQINTLRA
jgi:hypothetical protein